VACDEVEMVTLCIIDDEIWIDNDRILPIDDFIELYFAHDFYENIG